MKEWFYQHVKHKHDFSDYSEYGERFPACTKCGLVSFHKDTAQILIERDRLEAKYAEMKDPNHLATADTQSRIMVYCLHRGCNDAFYIHDRHEVTMGGIWYCPEHLTEARFYEMLDKGFK